MPKVTINDKELEVDAGISVLQACERGRARDSTVLLPRAVVYCRKL